MNFQELLHWKGDGRNHVIIDTSLKNQDKKNHVQSQQSLGNIGKAMIASVENFKENALPRLRFDILVPKFKYFDKPSDIWRKLPMILPVRREYLIYYKQTQDEGFIL